MDPHSLRKRGSQAADGLICRQTLGAFRF